MEIVKSENPDVEFRWRAFELRPEPVPVLDPNSAYIQNAWRDSVKPLAQRLNVTMNLPPVQPRSRQAHEAAHWAREQGAFETYHAAVFRAFFERGENIGEIDVLVRLAADLGLDGSALEAALERRLFEKSVAADVQDAARFNVRAVPAFVMDEKVVLSGVQPVERLKSLIAGVPGL